MPNIWRLGRVGNTRFGRNFSNWMLLNAAKCQVYSFYHFWVIKGKPTGRAKSPRLGLRESPGKKNGYPVRLISWKKSLVKKYHINCLTVEEVINKTEDSKIDALPRKFYNQIRAIISSSSDKCVKGNKVFKMKAVVFYINLRFFVVDFKLVNVTQDTSLKSHL